MALGTSIPQLKIACLTILKADVTLTGLTTGIFDQKAPTGQAFRYITLDSSTELSDNTMGKGGRDCTITFSIYAQDNGSKYVLQVADQLIKLIDHQQANITALMSGQTCDYAELEFNDGGQMQSDGLTLHVTLRFRFLTQEV